MDYILNIHTTTETAIVNICDEKKVIATMSNSDSKEHAKFLHVAIHKILGENNIDINKLKAIGVTNGPGSYTGIRVGLATAKGLSFSLKIPLITFNALEVMVISALEKTGDKNALYCPMIDARRMEVFTGVYEADMAEVIPPSAIILEPDTFEEIRPDQSIYFFGNGSKKLESLNVKRQNFKFIEQEIISEALCQYSSKKFQQKKFDNVAFAEPLYIKEFYTPAKK